MTDGEHLAVGVHLMQLANNLQADGELIAMSEMLWGAVNRLANALAIQHGLAVGDRMPRGGSVIHHLVYNHNASAALQDNWSSAGALHGHFYNSHLAPLELNGYVLDTRSLITELVRRCR